MALVGELPAAEALMRRALELDEAFDDGALHEFFIAFEGGRGEAMGGSEQQATAHFERAVELQGGRKAGPFVALAATVAVARQDLAMFEDLLQKALAVDVDAVPEWRLANILARDKARRLMDMRAELFLDYEEEEE
jgi:hypothetical protein